MGLISFLNEKNWAAGGIVEVSKGVTRLFIERDKVYEIFEVQKKLNCEVMPELEPKITRLDHF